MLVGLGPNGEGAISSGIELLDVGEIPGVVPEEELLAGTVIFEEARPVGFDVNALEVGKLVIEGLVELETVIGADELFSSEGVDPATVIEDRVELDASDEVGIPDIGGVPLAVVDRPCALLTTVLTELVLAAGLTDESEVLEVTPAPATVW